jgi:cyclin H
VYVPLAPHPSSLRSPHPPANHSYSREQKVTYKAQLQPIRKKLNKCRDPDRWNLVELQRSRREQVLNKGGGGGSDDGGNGGGSAGASKDDDVFGGDAKRRKVAKGAMDDPFGGAL